MAVPARFRWVKEDGRFAAYPVGWPHKNRVVYIVLSIASLDTSTQEFRRWESWSWTVNWDGWFKDSGSADSKQAAADKATEAWWKAVTKPLPRDVETEIDMIVARVLVMPPPNSAFMEDMAFLQRLNRSLFSLYEAEIKADRAPQPVRNLLDTLSAELYRRRLAGE